MMKILKTAWVCAFIYVHAYFYGKAIDSRFFWEPLFMWWGGCLYMALAYWIDEKLK